MKSIVVALALVAWLIQSPAAKDRGEQPPHTGGPQTSAESKDSQTLPPVLVQKISNRQSEKENGNSQEGSPQKEAHDWIDRLNAISTLVIAAFTILLFIGLVVQISTSRDTERAWVIVSPAVFAPQIGYIPVPNDTSIYGRPDSANMFVASAKNTGNTPARLLELTVKYKQISRLQDIPPEPDYGPRKPPSDEILLVKDDSAGAAAYLEPNMIVTRDELFKINRKESFLYAYGIAVYLDAFQRRHETRFGYVYHFPHGGDPRPTGFLREFIPSAYNTAT